MRLENDPGSYIAHKFRTTSLSKSLDYRVSVDTLGDMIVGQVRADETVSEFQYLHKYVTVNIHEPFPVPQSSASTTNLPASA